LLKELKEVYHVDIPTLETVTGMSKSKIEGIESMITPTDKLYEMVGREKPEKPQLLNSVEIEFTDEQLELLKMLQDYANTEQVKDAIIGAIRYMLDNMRVEDAALYVKDTQ
jgi:hypothetical protein